MCEFIREQLWLRKKGLRRQEDERGTEVRESPGDRVRLGVGQEEYR